MKKEAHLDGEIAKALMASAPKLLASAPSDLKIGNYCLQVMLE